MSESEFVLALDMGMSRMGAATARLAQSEESEADFHVLGRGGGTIAAVAYVTDAGDLLFGDSAEDAGAARPDRVVRGFLRDVGDETPLMVGDRSVASADLTARYALWAREEVARAAGRRPSAIALTHPSSWTGHRIAALRDALSRAGVTEVELVGSAEAVAHHRDAPHPIARGETVAVYDLGGTSFEATVLQKRADGSFAVRGTPVTLPDHAGTLFDDAVLAHALAASGADLTRAASEPEVRSSLAELRRSAVTTKHALSLDGEATMTIGLTGDETTVRITRSEFEAAIEPALDRTLDALERAIDDAGRAVAQIDLILLSGGSTHIPLVAQRLSDRFDRPLAAMSDCAGALGAARVVADRRREAAREAAASASPAPARPPAPRHGLLAALRPAITRAAPRATAAVTIVAATVVVAAGFAATAFGAGIGDQPAQEFSGGSDGSLSSFGIAAASIGSPLDVPLRSSESPAEHPVTVDLPQTPETVPEQTTDRDVPVARRTVREPLGEVGQMAPTTRSSTSSPGAQTPATGTTPGAPRPVDAAPTDPSPVAPPADGTASEEPSPVDPPPADPPPEDPPAEEIPAETDPGAVIPAGARLAEAPASDL